MDNVTAGAIGLLLIAVLIGPVLIGAFWVIVLRLGLAPVRREIARLADESRLQNEIAMDDELQPSRG